MVAKLPIDFIPLNIVIGQNEHNNKKSIGYCR
jgi:hypothetical protein